jgi:hypothetical protein
MPFSEDKIDYLKKRYDFNEHFFVYVNTKEDAQNYLNLHKKIFPDSNTEIITHAIHNFDFYGFNIFSFEIQKDRNLTDRPFRQNIIDGSKLFIEYPNQLLGICKIFEYHPPTPSYKPRRIERTLENYEQINEKYFYDNEELESLGFSNIPLMKIDDKVKLKENALEIYNDSSNDNLYSRTTELVNTITNSIGKEFIIKEKFKYELNNDIYPWWSSISNEGDSGKYIPDMLIKKVIEAPSYKPKQIKRTLENYEHINEDYFYNNYDLDNADTPYKPLTKIGDKVKIKVNAMTIVQNNSNEFTLMSENINFINDNIGKVFEIRQKFKNNLNRDSGAPWWSKISEVSGSYLPDMILEKYIPTPSYKPKQIKRTLENFDNFNRNDILYVFDMDDTLVYSDEFEDHIRPLLNENITPEEIFNIELSKIDSDLSNLKYEHGRIYMDDPEKIIIIPKNSSWVRKKDRIYLTTPESYYMTTESMPNKTNKTILDLYNGVKDKAIVTARKEKYRDVTELALETLGIESPNYGLFMYPDETHSFKSKWKSDRLLELYDNDRFNEIHYYDDNIKLLKKMKHYLSKHNKNIYLYKVSKDSYRKI